MTRLLVPTVLAAGFAALLTYVAAADEASAKWVQVARDANYEIQIDTSRIHTVTDDALGRGYSYAVRFRTLHAQPRLYKGEAFDREVVASIVRCDRLWFKVESVDMRMGERKLVRRQRMTEEELRDSPWRRVERGTTEEVAALATCRLGHMSGS